MNSYNPVQSSNGINYNSNLNSGHRDTISVVKTNRAPNLNNFSHQNASSQTFTGNSNKFATYNVGFMYLFSEFL